VVDVIKKAWRRQCHTCTIITRVASRPRCSTWPVTVPSLSLRHVHGTVCLTHYTNCRLLITLRNTSSLACLLAQHDTFDVKHFWGSLCCLQRYISCLFHIVTYLLTDPEGMGGAVDLGITMVSKQSAHDRYATNIAVVSCSHFVSCSHCHVLLGNWSAGPKCRTHDLLDRELRH